MGNQHANQGPFPRREPTHRDWAEQAAAAERAEDWPQAAALWGKASDVCDDPECRADFGQALAGGEVLMTLDAELASIAERDLRIRTLEIRRWLVDMPNHRSIAGMTAQITATGVIDGGPKMTMLPIQSTRWYTRPRLL